MEVSASASDPWPSFGGVFRVVNERAVESSTASSYVSWSWCYGAIRVSWRVSECGRSRIVIFNKGGDRAGKGTRRTFSLSVSFVCSLLASLVASGDTSSWVFGTSGESSSRGDMAGWRWPARRR